MAEPVAENEKADEKVLIYMPSSLLREVDRRVEVQRKASPDTQVSRGLWIKTAVREYLRRHP